MNRRYDTADNEKDIFHWKLKNSSGLIFSVPNRNVFNHESDSLIIGNLIDNR